MATFCEGLLSNLQAPQYCMNKNICVFSLLEKDAGIPALFEERKIIEGRVKPHQNALSTTNRSLQEIRYQIDRIIQEYGVGLEERQAGIEKPVFPIQNTSASLDTLRAEEARLLVEKTRLENEIKSFDKEFKAIDDRLKKAYEPVFRSYNWTL